MTLYQKVQTLCRNAGFEISNLGDHIPGLNITRGTISRWKRGAVPRAATVKKIADYFHVSPDYFDDVVKSPSSEEAIARDSDEIPSQNLLRKGKKETPDLDCDGSFSRFRDYPIICASAPMFSDDDDRLEIPFTDEEKLTSHEEELLRIYKVLDAVDQAKLLVFAASLEKKKR